MHHAFVELLCILNVAVVKRKARAAASPAEVASGGQDPAECLSFASVAIGLAKSASVAPQESLPLLCTMQQLHSGLQSQEPQGIKAASDCH